MDGRGKRTIFSLKPQPVIQRKLQANQDFIIRPGFQVSRRKNKIRGAGEKMQGEKRSDPKVVFKSSPKK